MAALERCGTLCLAAGTSGGLVEVLDAETAALTASMLATPNVEVRQACYNKMLPKLHSKFLRVWELDQNS